MQLQCDVVPIRWDLTRDATEVWLVLIAIVAAGCWARMGCDGSSTLLATRVASKAVS